MYRENKKTALAIKKNKHKNKAYRQLVYICLYYANRAKHIHRAIKNNIVIKDR